MSTVGKTFTVLHWRKLMLWIVLIIVLQNLLYLPGPSFLYAPAYFLFFVNFLITMVSTIVLPISVIAITFIFLFLRRETSYQTKKFFIVSSLVSFLIIASTFWLGSILMELSRNIAINRASGIIELIENYKLKNHKYPISLTELTTAIPKTGVIGIRGYNYSIDNNVYQLSFSQAIPTLINSEVVIYNPLDRHISEYPVDTLYDTGKSHWKYYIYD